MGYGERRIGGGRYCTKVVLRVGRASIYLGRYLFFITARLALMLHAWGWGPHLFLVIPPSSPLAPAILRSRSAFDLVVADLTVDNIV